jgi:aspartate carbamoyltransferase catalytic subunit
MNRHLISAADLSKQDALLILDTAEELAQVADRPIKKLPTLRGRTVVNLFFEDSTRTRISFEAAAKRLSADVINFAVKGSSVAKGESLKDTALTLEAMGADAVVVRHSASGAPHRLSNWLRGSVINAGDGAHEHWTGCGSRSWATCCTAGSPGPMSGCCTCSGPRSRSSHRPPCCRWRSTTGRAR